MKNNLVKSCRCAISMAAVLTVAGLVPAIHAQTLPVGSWDCVIGGARQGTAFFQFLSNGTFTVTEMIVPNPPPAPPNPADTRGGEGEGRSGTSTNSFTPSPQIFGIEQTNGFWALNSKGQTIGFFEETSEQVNCAVTPIPFETNTSVVDVPFSQTVGTSSDPTTCVSAPTATNNLGGGVTNYTETTICSSNIVVCTALSNAVSFVGTVSTKRIVLKCKTPFGNTSYEGVPDQTLPDISGNYSGIRTQAGVSYQEFLTLALDGSIPNLYDVSLNGPGYSYTGVSLVSSQKKISFVLGLIPPIPTNQVTVVRAVTGSFNAKNVSANTVGWDQANNVLGNRERFRVQELP